MENESKTLGILTSEKLKDVIKGFKTDKAPEHPETLGELGLMNLELTNHLMFQEELITELYKVLHKLKAPGIAEEVSTLPIQESGGCRIDELKVIDTILRNNNTHLYEILCRLKDII